MRHRLCKVISCDSGLERVQTAGEAHPESKECVAIAFENEPDNWHSHVRSSPPLSDTWKVEVDCVCAWEKAEEEPSAGSLYQAASTVCE